MKDIKSNTMLELSTKAVKSVPMTPEKNFVHYHDITAIIAIGDDYQLLIENGNKILEKKYGSKSQAILSEIKKRARNKIF